MFRTNASRSITAVTDKHAVRNRAISLFISKAVSANSAPFRSYSEQTMPKTRFAAHPKPTVRGFINLCPKCLRDVLAFCLIRAFSRTVVAYLCGLTLKLFATNNTGLFDLIGTLLSAASGRTKALAGMARATKWLAASFTSVHQKEPQFCKIVIALYHSKAGQARRKTREGREVCYAVFC